MLNMHFVDGGIRQSLSIFCVSIREENTQDGASTRCERLHTCRGSTDSASVVGARSAGSMSIAGAPARSSWKLLTGPCAGGSSAKDAAAALPYASFSST